MYVSGAETDLCSILLLILTTLILYLNPARSALKATIMRMAFADLARYIAGHAQATQATISVRHAMPHFNLICKQEHAMT